MARKKGNEIPSLEELQHRVLELDMEIFYLRNELSVQRKLEKPHLLKAKKRERARALTFLTIAERNGKLTVGKE